MSVSQAKVEVVDRAGDGRFTAKVEAAGSVETRRVLLAYGIRNSLPNLEGIEELWGKSVVDCPFCHGWEVREAAIAADHRREATNQAMELAGRLSNPRLQRELGRLLARKL